MRRSLQSKFNLLALVLVVFFLLMLPMSTQVKADTRESLRQARSTLMAKWMQDLSKGLNPPKDIGDAQVEEWEQRAREGDPNCGEDCDPDADRDGDGVSNGDEVKNSEDPNCEKYCNPSCNEDEKGVDFCKNQDPLKPPVEGNETKPPPVPTYIVIFNNTWTSPGNCNPAPTGGSCVTSFPLDQKVVRMVGYLNVSNIGPSTVRWDFRWNGPDGARATWDATPTCTIPPCPPTDGPFEGIMEEPSSGVVYTAGPENIQSPQPQGRWHLIVYGLVS